ncbi:AlpA family phage regulatory protein [Photobacterium gaetbulicola]|uniref:AlpA family phage regulatory protein n=1 Tax=Photobacterium gaetbulicola TaxID=1295392 RepID=UPI0005CC3C67|nr:AlpA family phage regulatory protein [Photobacterium gaetbulicola]PSU02840.1 AlpA family phage regulatory protein [Photobacterium gaetbulicola]
MAKALQHLPAAPTNQIVQTDRLIRERERRLITSISRSHCYKLEQDDRFPKRVVLGPRSVAWKLSEILTWLDNS